MRSARAMGLTSPRVPGEAAVVFDPLTSIPWHSAVDARAAAGHGAVHGTAWLGGYDDSGNGRVYAATAGSAFAPYYQATALNSHPALWCQRSSPTVFAQASYTALTGTVTKVWIGRLVAISAGVNYQTLFDGIDSTHRMDVLTSADTVWWIFQGGGTITGGTVDTLAHVIVAEYVTGGNATLWLDGTQIATGSAGGFADNGSIIGCDYAGTNGSDQYLGFYGVINRAVTSGERDSLRTWAQSYYGTV